MLRTLSIQRAVALVKNNSELLPGSCRYGMIAGSRSLHFTMASLNAMSELVLLPVPREIELTGGLYPLESGLRLILDAPSRADLLFAAQRLQVALESHAGVEWSLAGAEAGPAQEIGAVLWVDPHRVPNPQG